MNEEEYNAWKKRITTILKMDGESEKFIDHLLRWMDSIKGKKEAQLIHEYHPDFKDCEDYNDPKIFDFIMKARYAVNATDKEYKLQMFDSAFFLYRALIKREWLDKMESIKVKEFNERHYCKVSYETWSKLKEDHEAAIGLQTNVQAWEEQNGVFFLHYGGINACYREFYGLEDMKEVELFKNEWYLKD